MNFLFLHIATLQFLVALYFFMSLLKLKMNMSETNYVTKETFELTEAGTAYLKSC